MISYLKVPFRGVCGETETTGSGMMITQLCPASWPSLSDGKFVPRYRIRLYDWRLVLLCAHRTTRINDVSVSHIISDVSIRSRFRSSQKCISENKHTFRFPSHQLKYHVQIYVFLSALPSCFCASFWWHRQHGRFNPLASSLSACRDTKGAVTACWLMKNSRNKPLCVVILGTKSSQIVYSTEIMWEYNNFE